ncbi:MAG: alpha/beta fold hydrolase [Opitutales bacterium]|nr:alpha/beta fold hydrolase [Opitutales bacterium]
MQTIWPNLFRRIDAVVCGRQRARLSLPDGDFLDVDCYRTRASRVAIVGHGLEGNSCRTYVLGMVRCLLRHGWDVIAWNCRGCSGEVNRSLRMYHSGATEDLHQVVFYAAALGYESMALVGSSMGGNLILKYLGERKFSIPPSLKGAVAYSVPCDLAGSSRKLSERGNGFYSKRFLRKLEQKLRIKALSFPDQIDLSRLSSIKTLAGFDDCYTAPLHGFSGSHEYYQQCSSKQFIPSIEVPTLIFNSLNDPFLSESCHPVDEAAGNLVVTLELLAEGGHVGFVGCGDAQGAYWSELRTAHFLQQCLSC